jgi:hypothetical protein
MPLKYAWTRTLIAGDEMAYDYFCYDSERGVGRVYRHHSMNAFGPGINRGRSNCDGNADTKDEAAALVERVYEACRV